MNTHPIYDAIATLLVEHFGIDATMLGPQVTFDDLGVDSLVIVEFALVVRKELGVVLVDGELTAGDTLAAAAEVISGKGAAA